MFRFDAKKEQGENASTNHPAVVEVPDVEAAAFKVMLSFIYTDDLSGLNGDNAMAVLCAAENRRVMLGPALFKIRFPLLSSEEFAKDIEFAGEKVGSRRFSETVHIKRLPWKIVAQITTDTTDEGTGNEKWLGIYLLCDAPKEGLSWKNTLGPNREGRTVTAELSESAIKGLMDQSNGFYNREEDKVTLAIDVTVKDEKMEKFFWDQNKLKWTLWMEIENLSEFAREVIGSERKGDTVYINGIAWEIVAQIRTKNESTDNEKWLGIYLLCAGPKEDKSWECKCSSTFRIVSQKSGVGDYKIRALSHDKHTFYSFENSWGFSNFASFAQLMDPSNDFYNQNEDKVTLAIDFTLKDEVPDDVIRVFEFNDHLLRRGPSSSGKTQLVLRLLRHANVMFDPPPKAIVWAYGEYSTQIPELERQGVVPHAGAPSDEMLKKLPKPCLIVYDDLMGDIETKKLADLYTKKSHHNNFSVIFLTQNLFDKSMRVPRSNAQYIFLMRAPNDMLSIRNLASQMFPREQGLLMDAYRQACALPYGYLLNQNIGERVVHNYDYLKKLGKTTSEKKRRHLLNSAGCEELLTLVEICLNVLNGNFCLSSKQKQRLAPFAKDIRQLARVRSERGARKYVQQSGGSLFAPLLAPILIEAARYLLSKNGQ
ncbi:hypothetical protein niasHT_018231 [Heterodera trifolii]|uniref:MATH domain-containing protein n=1 Tax=Heterodera trifolii TaxID=157864 RepID=A0ABD2KUH2_9BILA